MVQNYYQKSRGDRGQLCLHPYSRAKQSDESVLTLAATRGLEQSVCFHFGFDWTKLESFQCLK